MTTTFTNCRLCLHGSLLPNSCLTISDTTGLIVGRTQNALSKGDKYIDLQNRILAPDSWNFKPMECEASTLRISDNSTRPGSRERICEEN